MKCILCKNEANLKEIISSKQLILEYRYQLNMDISFPQEKIGFYNCPICDYSFFADQDKKDISGDNNFYNTLNQLSWYYFDQKHEYSYVKQLIKTGDNVIEVGCGKAAFAKYIPQANYTGLELSTNAKKIAQENGISIENISIQDYAKSHPNQADIVCSFQVLEHVGNPHSFIQSKIDACKGGGVYYYSCA